MGVSDISADYQGSIEFTSRFTSIEEPFLLWDAVKGQFVDKICECTENCVLFTSVDHIPAEMPKEASNHFGEKLYPFIKAVALSDINKGYEEMDDIPLEIKNATICHQGKLTPPFKYIVELRMINEETKAK